MLSRKTSRLRRAISTVATVVIVVVIIVIVAGAGFYALTLNKSSSTTAQTTTTGQTNTSSIASSSTTTPQTSTSGATSLDPANQFACASQEGKLSIYGLIDTPDFNQYIASAWNATYPQIKISYLGLDSGTLLNKALAEHKSGAVQSDVIESFVNAFYALNQSGAILAWQNPMEAQMHYPASALDPSNIFHPYNDYITTPAYNTKEMSSPQLPKNWTDLLTNPAFKGKFAYSKPSVLGTGAGIMYGLDLNLSLSYGQWINLMKTAAANSPVLTEDDGGSMTDVVTGQVPIGIGGTNDIQAAEAANGTLYAPLWLNPVFVSRVPIGISQGAPDPCAAKLFVEWATSMPGQLALGKSLRTPALPAAAQSESNILLNPPSNDTLFYYDQGQYITNVTGLSSLYTQIFGS